MTFFFTADMRNAKVQFQGNTSCRAVNKKVHVLDTSTGDGDGPQALRRGRLHPPVADSPVRGAVKRSREDDGTGSDEDDHLSKKFKAELTLL